MNASDAPPPVFDDLFHVLRFAGADASDFVQGQSTCDVAALTPERWTWGAYCSPKGRVLGTFMLWREGADLCMLLPASIAAGIARRLRLYVLRSKVSITEEDQRTLLGFASGGRTPWPAVLPSPPEPGSVRCAGPMTLLGLPGGRSLALAPHDQSAALAAQACPATAWAVLSIQHGEPWVTAPTQEAFVPQMLSLERLGGVSFTKGCYPGQEIVARTQHLGQVKRRLCRLVLAGSQTPAAGTPVYTQDASEAAGIVLAAAPGDGEVEVLAVVQIDAVKSGLLLGGPRGPGLEVRPFAQGAAVA